VRHGETDFAAIARGCGIAARAARTGEELADAMREALEHEGPFLIDATVDPAGYGAVLEAIRGSNLVEPASDADAMG
jgi:thiamine pyrophosphate-dependent acetolactate synthase large subunit-like protein